MRFLVARCGVFGTALLFAAGALSAPPLATAQTSNAAPIVWPTTLAANGGKIVLYEPQVRSWSNYARMTGVAAVAVTLPGAAAPNYGTLSFSSLASADVPSGTVSLVNPKVDATMWPSANPADAAPLDAFVKANLHLEGKPLLPLPLVLASLPPADRPHTVPVRTNPPVIYVSQRPAVLVVFDGKPTFASIAGTSLTYAVNTNWEIIHDPASSLYYAHARRGWFAAASIAGPFLPAVAPASFAGIPATAQWQNVRSALTMSKPAGTVAPRVFVSTVPAALIDIDGQPKFASIAGTGLRYVTNTTSDVFFSRDTTLWYVLLSGRWFAAANLNGPWTFASARLPADFKKIPEDSPRARVLVAVPGTTQAFYAARMTQLPHVTAVDPATTTLTVTYGSGAPIFAPIPGTPLKYAVNASDDVIQVDAAHYVACAHAVWFAAAAPNGPWAPATYVPAAVYTIPESSPLYHVTFVHVYDARGVALTAPRATPAPQPADTYQNFAPSQFSNGDAAGYYNANTAGYLGSYAPIWGGATYGTGYYYPGWMAFGAYVYNPPTYGNYNDTTYARERALSAANDPRNPTLSARMMPGHGPRAVPGPNTNVYAAADGVYRFVADDWQKNTGGDTWATAIATPDSLNRDRRARIDGYRGEVSNGGA